MVWMSGYIQFETPPERQHHFAGDITIKKVESVVFHGVVMEDEGGTPVPGALVKVFARINDGKEEALCHTFSGSDGHYLAHVEKKHIPVGVTAFVVRASAGSHGSGNR